MFNESKYLEANADVLEAMNNGKICSGFVHWLLYGIDERRTISGESSLD